MTSRRPPRTRPDGVFVSRGGTTEEVVLPRTSPARPQPENARPQPPPIPRAREPERAASVPHTPPGQRPPVPPTPQRNPAPPTPQRNPAPTARLRDARTEGDVTATEVAFGDMRAPVRPPDLPPRTKDDPIARKAAAILDDLGRAGPGYEQISLEPIRALGPHGVAALVDAFPGLLWFDRRAPHHRVPRGRDVSPIASLLFQLYPSSLPGLLTLLEHDDAEVRYYATLIACDLAHGDLTEAVTRRLFDTDKAVVRLAMSFQSAVGGEARVAALAAELAASLSAFDAGWARRMRAIELLGAFRAMDGLRALVSVLDLGDTALTDTTRRTLRVLVAHDFGPHAKSWQGFVQKHARSSRHAVLLDGLVGDDATLRDLAAEELAALVGNACGYTRGCDLRAAKAARQAFERMLPRR